MRKRSPRTNNTFPSLVQRVVDVHLPGRRLVHRVGGSGPILEYEPQAAPERPRLGERVRFQRGLHGGAWFRVELVPVLHGDAAGGRTIVHELRGGQMIGNDRAFSDTTALAGELDVAGAELRAAADAFFAPYRAAYAEYDRLLGPMPEHYARWFAAGGSELPLTDFMTDDQSGRVPAFDAFSGWLCAGIATEGLLPGWKVCLWRFWHEGRPMRAGEYARGEHYYCSECPAFLSLRRGRLIERLDRAFGPYTALVCPKHS
jgi:hypothetical protein